jgi:acetyltransferase-like isoleucine patch superfamily enzyme
MATAPSAPLHQRVAALRSELGWSGVVAIAWSRAWMSLAGIPIAGRMAVRIAAAACPPYYGRHRLARYHPRGFVAPRARISHTGFRSGRNVFVGDEVVILRDRGGGSVILGDRVYLNEGVRIVTSQGGSVEFGPDAHVQAGCYFVAIQGSIRVGAKVQIAPNCAFYPYEHGIAAGRSIQEQPLRSKGDIEIGDDAWLGHGVIVLSGVSIGEGTAVGAGSVVTKSLPANVVAMGSPARVVRNRS